MTSKTIGPFRPSDVNESNASGYPEPFASEARKRHNRRLGDHAGLTAFGVVMTRVEPGGRSSQRHAHTRQDEFVYVLEGEITLHDDAGKRVMRAGECVGFPAGTGNAHSFLNEGTKDAVFLVVGNRSPDDVATYPDVDLKAETGPDGRYRFTRRDGTAY
jgi:uncharacterized cupin superfamily protein